MANFSFQCFHLPSHISNSLQTQIFGSTFYNFTFLVSSEVILEQQYENGVMAQLDRVCRDNLKYSVPSRCARYLIDEFRTTIALEPYGRNETKIISLADSPVTHINIYINPFLANATTPDEDGWRNYGDRFTMFIPPTADSVDNSANGVPFIVADSSSQPVSSTGHNESTDPDSPIVVDNPVSPHTDPIASTTPTTPTTPTFDEILRTHSARVAEISSASTEHGFIHPGLALYTSPSKGLGVFAKLPFRQYQLIEVAPTIVIPDIAAKVIRDGGSPSPPNILEDYIYPLDVGSPGSPVYINNSMLVVMGWGMLYNDCTKEVKNLAWEMVKMPAVTRQRKGHMLTDFAVVFRVTRNVSVGEELCWDYGDAYWSERKRSSS